MHQLYRAVGTHTNTVSGWLRAKSLPAVAFCLAHLLVAAAAFAAGPAGSQPPVKQTPLVLAENQSDAAVARRIGGGQVQVEHLDVASRDNLREFHMQNARILQLVNFKLVLFRCDGECLSARFWRDRLEAANPRGATWRLPQAKSGKMHPCERMWQRAVSVHRALVSTMPQGRAEFDANLQTELQRIHRLKSLSTDLASQ